MLWLPATLALDALERESAMNICKVLVASMHPVTVSVPRYFVRYYGHHLYSLVYLSYDCHSSVH